MRTQVIDGVEIPESLIAREAQNHPEATAPEAWAAAGHALALRALLLRRALELRLEGTPEADTDGREETEEEALIRALLDAELEVSTPTEAELRRVYESDPRRFRTPPLSEAAHILIEVREGGEAALAAGQVRAAELIRALTVGDADFAAMAAEHSDCPSGGVGGSLGQLHPGDLVPEVEDVLASLQPGEICPEPVLSRYGWHVLKLERRIDGRRLPFEAVAERIRMHLESRAWAAAAARYAASLTAEARAQGVALSLRPDGSVAEGSLTLGDFLGEGAAASRLQPWLAATDPDLGARLERAAEAAGEETGAFVAHAMAEFLAEADDVRWTNLISTARDAPDPALACLATVLRSKVEPAKRTFTLIRRA